MTSPPITLLGHDGAATLRATVAHCLDESPTPHRPPGPVTIAGIGTTAPHALQGRLLLDALAARGLVVSATTPVDGPQSLLAAPGWDLALVLSPWKRDVATAVAALSPSAEATGVVDTVVRGGAGEALGVNTNSWAAQAAMETVTGGAVPRTVLVLGSGGSTHSVALGVRRAWPGTRLVGTARRPEALTGWATQFDAEVVAPARLRTAFADDAPTLVVNTTTWGETDASEKDPFAFPFAELLAPGNAFFDLNNRVSTLQTDALRAGMSVMSGTFMQRATNSCRAALLAGTTP
ncbi:hypothetical protein [Pseudonocardia sp. HH130629-09]|uniref:hypothetical protein n=1 Tax=Pseudonocardia sp. HH130629-09 TaxID=1641402 RepID=UPI0006CB5058|nr:hypothetical protein [Pseudonocardia sp. HH130629-09]ALE86087.1 hypothetical protein XF36_25555 [Pseudonocardia sp. HH130629-09]